MVGKGYGELFSMISLLSTNKKSNRLSFVMYTISQTIICLNGAKTHYVVHWLLLFLNFSIISY